VLNSETGQTAGALTSAVLPAFHGQKMYTISGKSLVATDIASGNIDWFFTPKEGISLPPITVNGFVYALSDTGNLSVHAPGGRLVQSFVLGLGSSSTLLHAPASGLGAGLNTLFVPSGSVLAAFAP
jgi:hypothetical protein